MKHLLITAAAAALLTACGGDKADSPPESAEAAIERATETAAEITVRSGDASEAGAALTALSLNQSGAGRVSFADSSTNGANASFSSVEIEVEEDEAPLKIGTLSFEGLETGDSGEANFGRMLMSDLSVSDDDSDTETEMKIASVELINPSPETAAWVASLMGDGDPAEFPAAADFGFDSWTMNALSVVLDEEDDAEGTFGIDQIVINGMKNERAASAVLSGMKLDMIDGEDGTKVDVNLDAITVSGADLKVLSALQNAGESEDEMASAVMDAMYSDPVDPGFDAMSVSNFTVDAGGANFALPSLNYLVDRNGAGEPTKLTVEPFTATLSADADAGEVGSQLAGGLGMIGYETMEFSGAGESDYDPENDIVSYEAGKNYFTLADGFTMNFGGKLEGYRAYSEAIAGSMTPEALDAANSQEMMTEALGALTVHSFEFSFEDDSFVDRMFNLAAAQSGEDPAQMRNQVVAMMSMAPMMAGGSGIDMELITEASGAVSSFISDPQTLTIKLDPEEPIAIGALIESGDPSGLTKSTLGFSASNE